MKTILALSLVAATAISLAGCNTPEGQNAAGGAVIGGATGALIGTAVSGGRVGGALVGGAIGATTGAMVGAASTPHRCAQYAYDYYGRPVCQAYY